MAQPRMLLRRLCSPRLPSRRPCRSLQFFYLQQRCPPRISQRPMSTGNPPAAEIDQGLLGKQLREEWAKYSQFPTASKASEFAEGSKVTIHGFLSNRRVMGSQMMFADIEVDNGPAIQVESMSKKNGSPAHKALRAMNLYSPVSVTGTIVKLHPGDGCSFSESFPDGISRIDLDLDSIQPLNVFPKDIIISKDAEIPKSKRHLDIRFTDELRTRLLARPHVGAQLRQTLGRLGFTEVETPILFKSTPEGAREFLVPTRKRGKAYALPQSPQQYKQILMASGVRRYFQFARCFRDEDLRADRQPEFTQLDLEMAFATGEDVMRTVEALVSELPAALNSRFVMARHKNGINGHFHPVSRSSAKPSKDEQPQLPWPEFSTPFPRITYEEAMSRYGSDKPDLRIPFDIRRVDRALPRHFIAKIVGDVKDPIIEAFRFRPDFGSGAIPRSEVMDSVRGLIAGVMKTLPEALAKNPVGQPAPLLVNSEQPMKGLSSLGFDGYVSLLSGEPGLEDFADVQDGDVLVFQARENKPFSGGSTPIGLLRTLFYQAALEQDLLPRSFDFKFLWVRDFPMFTPNNRDDPGQGGKSGFSATHHPFTAPLTDADVELLATDPLKARADHYDLVVNGIELGGGSRRIHLAAMQEHIMRDVLKMPHGLPLKGVEQFRHLLEALRAGCPPHAGFALGFDRLCAVLTGTDSVRDVIAFPKNMKGADVLVKSPSAASPEQLEVYHLRYTAIPLPGRQEQEES